MTRDIDAAYEDYTAWLFDLHTAPGTLQCDNCDEYFEDDKDCWHEFADLVFCCDACFQESLLTNPDLRLEWLESEFFEDGFLQA